MNEERIVWVPVDQAMPPENEDVAVFVEYEWGGPDGIGVNFAWYNGAWQDLNGDKLAGKVTHWATVKGPEERA
jgi:hypothetical protein